MACKMFSFWNWTNIFCPIFHFYSAPSMSKHYTEDIIFIFIFIMKIRKSGRCNLFKSSSQTTVQKSMQLPVHYLIVYWTGTLCSA